MKIASRKILFLHFLVISSLQVRTQNNSIDSLKRVLEIQKEDSNKVNTLIAIGDIMLENDGYDYKVALQYSNMALSLSEKINFDSRKARIYFNIGRVHYFQHNYSISLKNMSVALQAFTSRGDKPNAARCLRFIGKIYDDQQNYAEALKSYFASLKVYEEIEDAKNIVRTKINIANVYNNQNDYSVGLKSFLDCLDESKKIGNEYFMSICYMGIGNSYFYLGKYAEALHNDSAALVIFKKTDDKIGIATFFYETGKIYEKQGAADQEEDKLLKAQENYFAALKILKQEKDTAFSAWSLANTYINLGNVSIKLRHFSDAKRYLEKCLQVSKNIGDKFEMRDAYHSLSTLDSIQGNYKQAYEHFKMFVLYRDSIVNEESIRKSEGYKMQYEFDKKEDQIKLLSAQNKLQTALAQQQSQRKNFAYAGIGVILLAGGYGLYRFRKTKRLQNQQALMNERLRISRELHDEVGATLSGIAMYSHLTREQIKQANTIEVEKSLNIMQQSAGEMVNKLNDIVWLVNPDQDSLQKLIQRLEEYARDMAAIKNMQAKINTPEHLHEHHLPIQNRRNIYLFCKEAINNAVKYSNGTLLELNIKEVDNKLEFSVSDNGKGFDAVMVRRGNGLENMQKRADEIGAKLIVQSKKDEGSLLSMEVKIN